MSKLQAKFKYSTGKSSLKYQEQVLGLELSYLKLIPSIASAESLLRKSLNGTSCKAGKLTGNWKRKIICFPSLLRKQRSLCFVSSKSLHLVKQNQLP